MRILLLQMFLCFGSLFAAETYSVGKTSLTIDPVKGSFSIIAGGEPRQLESAGVLWSFRIFNEEAKALNSAPLHGQGAYCGIPWKEAPAVITSGEAHLTGSSFENGKLTLRYSHPCADVEQYFDLTEKSVAISGKIRNRGAEPICDFTIVPGIRFRLGEDETLIAPDPLFNGVEFSKVYNFSWSMRYAWDGFLIRESGNKGFFAFDNIQDIDQCYLASGGAVFGDAATGKHLRYRVSNRIFARQGEERAGVKVMIHRFASLREWADEYIRLNFPRGIRKLREKFSPEMYEKLSRAYLAPSVGTIGAVTAFTEKAPGTFIVHPTEWMHPTKGNPDAWDAFPNYFPPSSAAGTQAEYNELVSSVVARGQLFMPRTSFFYWTEGSDFDLAYGLRQNAIVRVDGLPRTARWGLPGYLMSPSAKPVAAELDRIFSAWRRMGANLYFTNVICALDPYTNRYDFHPDAPAPDLFYDQLYKLLKHYGEQIPLFSEGGGFWQISYQAGVTGAPAWDKERPIGPVQDDPARGIMVRSAPEVPLFLAQEYCRFYPSNHDYASGPYSIQRLSWSLAHGMNLKCGFYTKEPMTRRNMLFLRSIAFLADRIQPHLYGKRLESYQFDEEKVVNVLCEGSRVLYNPSAKEVAFRAGVHDSLIAPDGFGFVSADGGTVGGFFSQLAGNRFTEPVLLILEERNGRTRVTAPLEEEELRFTLNGTEIAIPAYRAALSKEIPGVEIDWRSGAAVADSMPDAASFSLRIEGEEEPPEVAPYSGTIPLQLNWCKGEELPRQLAPFRIFLTEDGLTLPRGRDFVFEDKGMVFDKSFYLEVIFRYDSEPTDPARWGEVSIVRPDPVGTPSYTRTIELRYHIYRDNLRFLLTTAEREYADMADRTFTVQKGRYFHIIARWDGVTQCFTVNGKTASRPLAGPLARNHTLWRLGDVTTNITISLLRIGGEAN